MSDRSSPPSDDKRLREWMRDVERALNMLMGGRNRGANSSWGLPFRMGDWEWYDNGQNQICARNVVTGVIQCPEEFEAVAAADACQPSFHFSADCPPTTAGGSNVAETYENGGVPFHNQGDGAEVQATAVEILLTGVWHIDFHQYGAGTASGVPSSVETLWLRNGFGPGNGSPNIGFSEFFDINGDELGFEYAHSRSMVMPLNAGDTLGIRLVCNGGASTSTYGLGSISGHLICPDYELIVPI